ncbi:MAG: 50S ribosomal protein L24 [Spirochaetales bacterium]|nr:50S ribosomal protein L24 [Spirochaetales bacterium]
MKKNKYKLKKNDQVKIITGKNIDNTGKILKINKANGTAIIEGQNMVKKAMRQNKQNQKGGIVEIEAPVKLSNIMILCKKCGPTRIGFKNSDAQKKKLRICKKCGEEL